MCGIAGIIGTVDEPNRRALLAMTAALVHRGPDATDVWQSDADADGHGCLLGFRRLSILDLSAAADQPMTDPVGGQTLVFNGEIYNYRELRDELVGRGESFTSSGDTAVLLRSLALDGLAACSRLRGMFAFGLWDPGNRQLTLARDPHGIKPLYVCRNPDPRGAWSVVFASEVRAIVASGLLGRPRLDPAAVESVLWNGFVMGPGTAIAGVSSILPGATTTIDRRGRDVGSSSYWSMPGSAPPSSSEELANTLRETVRLHLASDVPLGVFLSGGVDSGVVANLAQRVSGAQPVQTFTLAFEEEALSEGAAARAIADAIGTEHQEILLTESDFVAGLSHAVDSLDQPTFDGLNSYVMAKAVRDAGLTVALAGTGGDELFGGYETFRQLPAASAWNRRMRHVPDAARQAMAAAVKRAKQRGRSGPVPPQSRWAKLPAMVAAGDDMVALYQLSYALFLPDLQRELLADGVPTTLDRGLSADMAARLETEVTGRSSLTAISILEQRCFLGERLLRDSDAASMAASLELRVPLVDHVLTGAVNRLDDRLRYNPVGRKQALRNAGLDGLDPALFERPKQGFQLPFDDWIRQHLGGAMEETMRDSAATSAAGLDPTTVARVWDAFRDGGPGIFWSRVWALYVLIRWCDANGVAL